METERGNGRKREIRFFDPGKISPTRAKNGVFGLSKVKNGPNRALNGPKGLKIVFLEQKIHFFGGFV